MALSLGAAGQLDSGARCVGGKDALRTDRLTCSLGCRWGVSEVRGRLDNSAALLARTGPKRNLMLVVVLSTAGGVEEDAEADPVNDQESGSPATAEVVVEFCEEDEESKVEEEMFEDKGLEEKQFKEEHEDGEEGDTAELEVTCAEVPDKDGRQLFVNVVEYGVVPPTMFLDRFESGGIGSLISAVAGLIRPAPRTAQNGDPLGVPVLRFHVLPRWPSS